MHDITDIFETIRDSASKAIWSSGVSLAKRNTVLPLGKNGSKKSYVVEEGGHSPSRSVELYFEDEDWLCDCPGAKSGKVDPCEHVVASVIAEKQNLFKQGPADGSKPSRSVPKSWFYWVEAQGDELKFFRGFECLSKGLSNGTGIKDRPILRAWNGSLKSIVGKSSAERTELPPITQKDLDIDSCLEKIAHTRHRSGNHHIGQPLYGIHWKWLAECFNNHTSNVAFKPNKGDSFKELALAEDSLGLALFIDDEAPFVRTAFREDPDIVKKYRNGAVMTASALHPAAEPQDFTPDELRFMQRSQKLTQSEWPSFVSEILPKWEKKLPVYNNSRLLPSTSVGVPGVVLQLEEGEGVIRGCPRLVYFKYDTFKYDTKDWDPQKGLPHLSCLLLGILKNGEWEKVGNEVPQRFEKNEKTITTRLEKELGLSLNSPFVKSGEQAFHFYQNLHQVLSTIDQLGIRSYRFFKDWNELLSQNSNGPIPSERQQNNITQNWTSLGELRFKISSDENEDDPFHSSLMGSDLGFVCESQLQQSTPHHASLGAVLKAWESGESIVPLLGGGWGQLPKSWLQKYGPTLKLIFESQKEFNGRVPKSLRPALKGIEGGLPHIEEETGIPDDLPPNPQAWLMGLPALVKTLPSEKTLAPFLKDKLSIPLQIQNAELRNYQMWGSYWLQQIQSAKTGALLADDMGLGKTIQVLSCLRKTSPSTPPTLIVTPTSVMHNWEKELHRFRPDLNVHIHHGQNRSLSLLDPFQEKSSTDVIILSYGILRLEIEELEKHPWDGIILDEGHQIKNPDSQVSRAAFRLEGSYRILMSGTPMENRPEDLWSLFRFLVPGLLGPRRYFKENFCQLHQPEHSHLLRSLISPYILRRKKNQVALELPEKTIIDHNIPFDEGDQKLYQVMFSTAKGEVQNLLSRKNILSALEVILRLRQLCCHRGLVDPSQSAMGSAKLNHLLDLLQEIHAEQQKALIFSQWTSFLDIIESSMKDQGYSYVRLDGQTRNRKAVVESFQETAGPYFLLSSLKAGGVGLNLTAADHVIIMDPWWNPFIEDQAADRAHRIGRINPVMVHRLIIQDSIEEKILLLQEHKRQQANAVLENQGEMLSRDQSETQEDLLSLF